MKSLRELFRIGQGPSSSHTMGPRAAAEKYLASHPDATQFKVTLYGSLAATGKGHLTDWAIEQVLVQSVQRLFGYPKSFCPFIPTA